MTDVLRLALKNLKHKPGRLVLATFAVVLGVALVSSTHVFTQGLTTGFRSLNSEIYGGDQVIVELDPDKRFDVGEGPLLDDATLSAIKAVTGVEAAYGGIGADKGQATMLGTDKKPALQGGPSLFFNWAGDPQVDRSTIVDGHAPEQAGEIAMDTGTADKVGYAIGDTVYVADSTGIAEFTLVGTIKFGESNSLQGASLNYVTDADARVLAGIEGYDSLAVLPAAGVDSSQLAERISPLIPDATRAITSAQKVQEENAQVAQVGHWFDIIGLAFAFISVFVGSYLVVNTFRIIVTQRTRELGLVRAIAASGKQVRTMILIEALAIATIATGVGLLFGWLLGAGFLAGVGAATGTSLGAAVLTPAAVLWALGVGYGVTVVAAFGPAIHASRIAPLEAIRDSSSTTRKPLFVRNTIGGALTVAGLIAIAGGLWVDVPGPIWWIAAGAVAIVLGATLLAAQVLVPLAYAMRDLLTKAAGVSGKLAANNIRREPRRSSNTAAALMIGVMLLSLTATFAESVRHLIKDQFSNNVTADVMVFAQSPDGLPEGAIAALQSVDGIGPTLRVSQDAVKYNDEVRALFVFDPATADENYAFDASPDMASVGDGVFIGPSVQDMGVKVGDTVMLDGPARDLMLTVTGLYNAPNDGDFFVSWDTGEALLGDIHIVSVYSTVEGRDVADVKADVTDALADFPTAFVTEPSELVKAVNQIVTLVIGIISGLLGSALVIAILGIANTLLLSVTERTREVGLLRAIGLGRRKVAGMITLESVVMALFGTVLGMILGTSLGVALLTALKSEGFTSIVVPWAWLGLYAVLAIIAGVVAAIWPARRASKLNILDAIASE